jgi:hypothetical protein
MRIFADCNFPEGLAQHRSRYALRAFKDMPRFVVCTSVVLANALGRSCGAVSTSSSPEAGTRLRYPQSSFTGCTVMGNKVA